MSWGAGHSMDMIARIRANNNLLKKRGYFKLKKMFLTVAKKENIEIERATKRKMRLIREKIIAQQKLERKKWIYSIILSFIAAIILFFILAFLIQFVFF